MTRKTAKRRARFTVHHRRSRRRYFRPRGEVLEDRSLLTAIFWNSDSSGFWDDPSNWSPQQVPGGGDDVTIDRGAANPTITIRDVGQDFSVNMLTSREALVIAARTLHVNGTSQIDASTLTLSGGNLNAFSTLTVTAAGRLTWQAGTVGGNGLTNSGTIDISASLDVGLAGTLTNRGTITHTGAGNLVVTGVLNNQSDGVYDLQSDAGIAGTNRIDNAGTLKKTLGGGTSRIGPSVGSDLNFNNNGGTLDVQSGRLKFDQLRGNNTNGGTWNASTNAVLEIASAAAFAATYGGTYGGGGGGRVELSSGPFIVTHETGPGVTFNFPPGFLQWMGGTIANTHPNHPFTNLGTLTLDGPNDKSVSGVAFNNNGLIIHAGTGNLYVSGTFNNNATGRYEFQGDADLFASGCCDTLNNAGTIRKSGGGDVSIIGVPIPNTNGVGLALNNNGGTLESLVGRLNLDSGGIWQNGTLNAAIGAVIEISGNPAGAGEFTGSGAGRVELSAGNFGSYDIGIAGGHATLNFPAGLFYWTGGGIASGGCGSGVGCATTLVNKGFITIEGANSKGTGGTGLINEGVIVNAGPGDFGTGSSLFENRAGALYEHRGDSIFSGTDQFNNAGRFINAGTFRKSAGSGTVNVTSQIDNTASGVIAVDAGRLTFTRGGNMKGGSFNADTGAVLDFAGNGVFNLDGVFTGGGLGHFETNAQLTASGSNGAIFDFPDGFFRWASNSWIFGQFTNNGSITLASAANKFARATIINNGTFTHREATELELNPDAVFENHGLYEFLDDGDIVVPNSASGGTMQFVNYDTLRKSGGLGISDIRLDARHPCGCQDMRFSNLGTVEVRTGTLLIDRPIAQTSGTTLTGGAWTVRDFATLAFHNSLAASPNAPTPLYTTNVGQVTLDGSQAQFPNIDGLIKNQGSFSLLNGRDFAVAGSFFNSGVLEAGAGSTLSIGGNLTSGNLVGWWRGEGDAADSANVLHGSLTGTVAFAAGQFGQAFRFPNTTGRVDLANPAALQLQTFTMEAWVKPAVGAGGPGTFLAGTVFEHGNHALRLRTDGRAEFCISTCVNSGSLIITNPDVFHQVAVTRNGNQIQFFLDGVAGTTQSLGGTLTFASNARIGNLPQGSIDELAIFDRVLTAAEIASLADVAHVPAVGRGDVQLKFGVGGVPASGQFGQIAVAGSANTSGQVKVDLVNGFGPTAGQVFPLVTYASRTGQAPAFNGLGAFFESSVTATDIHVTAIGSTTDIGVDPFNAPVGGLVGQDVTINFTVQELDNIAITGDWTDSIYLSRNDSLSADDKLIGRVPHTGGLAALGIYSASLTAPLPPVATGDYRVLVVADSGRRVADADRANNTRASSNFLHLDVPELSLGGPLSNTIANGEAKYYRIDVPAGAGDLVLDATFAVANEAELFVRQGDVPASDQFDFSANELADLTRRIVIRSPQAGAYYVLVRGRDGAAAPQSFSLAARLANFEIRDLAPDRGSNLGSVTLTVHGSGFTPDAAATLIAPGGGTRGATTVRYRDSETLFVSFDLRGLGAGAGYDVRIVDAAGTTTANDVFTVTTGAEGRFEFTLSAPKYIRTGRSGEATVTYRNAGETDIAAPLMLLTGRNATFRLPGSIQFGDERLEFLAINDEGPAGILPPGASSQITIEFNQQTTGLHVTSDLQVGLLTPQDPIDWTKLELPLRPPTMQADAWSAIWANVVADFGTSFSQYQGVMAETASYLSTLGIYTPDIARLLAFRERIADDFGHITSRYALGPYGRGQLDPLRIFAGTEPNGSVSIQSPGLVRPFLKLADGSYVGMPGETGSLTRRSDGSYRLDDLDGSVLMFRTDGLLDFQQDRNGYRTTWSYDGAGRVTTLTESNGDTIRFSYNAQGRISTVTDRVGRVTTYTYDAGGAGEHLVQVSSAAGTTRISYITGMGAQREHAVSMIEFPDGTVRNFEYDARGRLIRQTAAGGALPTTFAYDSVGGTTITDPSGKQTLVRRNDLSLAGQIVDPLGNAYLGSFDANRQLIGFEQPGGRRASVSRDAKGNVTQSTDPLGNETEFAYSVDFRRQLSMTDARGSTTTYSYDALGHLITKTGPDGLSVRSLYDSRGNQVYTQFASGRDSTATIDARNLLVRRDFNDGTHITYSYDGHRNLTAITGASGTTAFQYDAADRPTKVTYPNGRFVEYTYDGLGRRTRIRTQDNFIVNYSYDALGRLARVSDGADATIVIYTYDPVLGRLLREDFGNGTSTTYDYDGLSRVTSIVSRDGNNTVLSQFGYTYNAAGQRSTMTTADGTTSYGYDALGQLVLVSLPGGRTINYEYDATGNRTRVTDAGTPTNYTPNDLDQYTAVGSATFTYDADGNVLTRTEGLSVTTYTYDVQNRLVGTTRGSDVWTYEYDVLGNRTAVVHNGMRTEFLIDPTGLGNVIGEYDGTGSLIAHYAHGGGLESRFDATGAAGFYEFDATGNVAALTGPAGTVTDSYSYLPFGEVLESNGSTPNPFTFVGKLGVMDSGDGLYFMRHRSYDPTAGRFTQRDPIGLLGGSTNVYQYVGNDPVELVDPSGLILEGAGPVVSTTFEAVGPVITNFFGASGITGGVLGPRIVGALGGGGGTLVYPPAAPPVAPPPVVPPPVAPPPVTPPPIAPPPAPVAPPAAPVAPPVTAPPAPTAPPTITNVALRNIAMEQAAQEAAQFSGQLLLKGGGLITAAATITAAGQHAAFNAQFNPEIKDTRAFTDADYVRNVRKARNNHPLLEATAKRIADINGHSEPTADDYDAAKKAIRKATADGTIEAVGGFDPNELIGPSGVGSRNFVREDALALPYSIHFENLANAPAPAQEVVVTQQLDANLDFATFALTAVGFGSFTIPISGGLSSFRTRVDATATLAVLVDVSVDLNLTTGLLTARFSSIDATTGDAPADPFLGFLPPNVTASQGAGFVNYVIRPKPGLVSGAEIRAVATIVFDSNAPITTNQIDPLNPASGADPNKEALVTIDAESPTSSVTSLSATTYQNGFLVSWTGTDDVNGAGLASYDVFVSTDNGPFAEWQVATTATSHAFDLPRLHTYSFYVIARDLVGHTEAPPATADAATFFLGPPWQNPENRLDVNRIEGIAPVDVLLVVNELNFHTVSAANGTLPLNVNELQFPSFDVDGDNIVAPVDALLVINFLNGIAGEGESFDVRDGVQGGSPDLTEVLFSLYSDEPDLSPLFAPPSTIPSVKRSQTGFPQDERLLRSLPSLVMPRHKQEGDSSTFTPAVRSMDDAASCDALLADLAQRVDSVTDSF